MRTGFLKKLLWTLMAFVLLFGAQALAEEGYQDHAELLRDGYLPAKQPMDMLVLRGETFEEYMLAKVEARETLLSIEAYQLTVDELQMAMTDLIDSNPHLFYVSNTWTCWANEAGLVTEIEISYLYSEAETARRMAAFDASVDAIVRYASQADTTLGKVMMVHDYLCVNYEYDQTYSIYSAEEMFRLGTGVCQAYLQCFQAVMNELGIDCVPVTSLSMVHGWNAVKVDGSWYHLDATWDDPTADMPLRACHQNFLLSDAAMAANGHYDWTAAVTASSTAYDSFFWSGVNNAIPVVGDVMYYVDAETADITRTVKAWDLSEGAASDVCSYDIYTVDGGALYAYGYNPIAASDSHLYYMTVDRVYGMPLAGGAPVLMHTTTGTDYIWSSWFDGSSLQVYAADQPGNAGTIITLEALETAELPFVYTDNGDGTCVITGYTGEGGAVSVPEAVNGRTVTAIGSGAFGYCEYVTAIHLPATVNAIAADAFMPYSGVTAFTVDENNAAFSAVDGVLFDKAVSTILCYPGRKTDAEYTAPDTVTAIGENAFYQNYYVQSVVLPESVETIGANAFEECFALTAINLPQSITSIGENAFAGCGSLTATVMQNSYAHLWCLDNGVDAVLEGGVSEDGLYTYTLRYDGTAAITGYHGNADHVVVPAEVNGVKVTMLGIGAFSGSGMSSIVLPEGLEVVAMESFAYTPNLQSIHLPSTATRIAMSAFTPYCGAAEITVEEGNPYLTAVDGVLYADGMSVLVRYPSGKTDESFTVPAGVTEIDMFAFMQNHHLQNVVLPAGVRYIEESAFDSCTALIGINLPESMQVIDSSAFANCTDALTASVAENTYAHGWCVENGVAFELLGSQVVSGFYRYIPNGDGTAAITAYLGADSHVEVPSVLDGMAVTAIASHAFHGSRMTSITLPESLQVIEGEAFSYCENLTSIHLPAAVRAVEGDAFVPYCGLTHITVDAANQNYTAVDGVLFRKDMSALVCHPARRDESAYIVPDGVKMILSYAFCQNYALERVVLPEGISYIESYAFLENDGLSVINLPDSLTYIVEGAFAGCTGLTAYVSENSYAHGWCVENGVDFALRDAEQIAGEYFYRSSGDGTAVITGYMGEDGYVEVPSELSGLTVTGIADNAFAYCEEVYTIHLPATVTDIAAGAFMPYCSVESFEVDEANPAYTAEDGVLFSKDRKTLVCYPSGRWDDAYAVPDGVTAIADYAVFHNSHLNTVSLPQSLRTIGEHAFEYCIYLRSIQLPSSVSEIGEGAFWNCGSLVAEVENGSYALDWCMQNDVEWKIAGLEFRYRDNGDGTCSVYSFTGSVSVLRVPPSIDGLKVTELSSLGFPSQELTTVILPDTLRKISNYAFSFRGQLTAVMIPASVTEISESAFNHFDWDMVIYGTAGSYAEEYAAQKGIAFKDAGLLPRGEYTSGDYTYALAGSDAIITGYAGSDANVLIPAQLDGHPVVQIAREAFAGSSIVNAVIPEGVTHVARNAFQQCAQLETVQLPLSLRTIGANAFKDCGLLRDVEFPENLTHLGTSCFENCASLNSVILPDSLSYLGDIAFGNCTSLTSVIMPRTMEYVGDITFQNCTSLTSVILPENIMYLTGRMFENCTSLKQITIPDGVVDIKGITFSCSGLTSIEMPDSVEIIGLFAFEGCEYLSSVELSDNVKQIGRKAFAGCTALDSLFLPDQISYIDSEAFDGNIRLSCNAGTLTEETLAAGGFAYTVVPRYSYIDYGDGTCSITGYTGREADLVIPSSIDGLQVIGIESYAFHGHPMNSVTLPEGLQVIDSYAFSYCQNLSSVHLPATVASVSGNAFAPYTGLQAVTVAQGNAAYHAEDGVLYSGATLALYPMQRDGASFAVPDGVTAIGSYAFTQNYRLNTVTLPQSVSVIGSGAFEDCVDLISINLPENIGHIGEGAFANCGSLTAYVTRGSYAHSWCVENGMDVKIVDAVTPGGQFVCADLGDGTCRITGYFGDEASVTVPDEINGLTVVSIGAEAFYGSSMSAVTLPQTLREIGSQAFAYCDDLTALHIPASVYSIAGDAFAPYCGIASFTAAQDSATFASADGVLFSKDMTVLVRYPSARSEASFHVPAGVTHIAPFAFSQSSALESVTLPETVMEVGAYAFEYGVSLQQINLPAGIYAIGEGAFDNCTSLTATVLSGSYAHEWCLENGAAFELDDTPSDYSYMDNGDGTCTIVDYIGTDAEIEIPAQINGLQVTGIGEKAFAMGAVENGSIENNSQLRSVVIPQGVTWIGANAFAMNTNLSSVVLPEGLISIGEAAFDSCDLQSLTLPDSITTIESWAFFWNMDLTQVDLPASLSSLGDDLFGHCKLTSLTIEQSNTSYQTVDNVLYTKDETALVMFPSGIEGTFSIPEGVTAIGRCAFSWSRLSEIVMPSSLKSIGEYAFSSMDHLKHLVLNDGLESIGEYAFISSKLESIQIPEGITEIPNYAFAACRWLKNVVLPSTITRIGDLSFVSCDALDSLVLPDHITEISENAFDGDTTAHTLYVKAGTTTEQTLIAGGWAYEIRSPFEYADNGDGTATITGYTGEDTDVVIPASVNGLTVTRIGQRAFHSSAITSVTLPETLTHIELEAFAYCTSLKEITLPAGVTEVEMYMDGQFTGCTALENIYAAQENTVYTSVDGVLFNKDVTTLMCFPAGRGGSYTVPATVQTIFYNAFATNDNLTELVLQEGVTMVDVGAFRNGEKLASVIFPENSMIIGIGNFVNCPQLVATVHENSDAHRWCVQNGIAFQFVSLYEYADNGDGTAAITGYTGETSTKLSIPAAVRGLTITAIAENALANLPAGANVWIPDTVTAIGEGAFPTDAVIRSSLGAYARIWAEENGIAWEHDFHHETVLEAQEPTCTADGHGEGVWCPDCGKIIVEPAMVPANGHLVIRLKDSTPATREQNGLKASAVCETCTEVLSEETTIESSRTLFLPAAIRHVADEAFTGSAAQQITLPEGAVSIGSKAFAACPNLILVVVPDSVQSIADDAFEGSDQVMLMCASENSYAAQWAQAHGAAVEILK